MINHALGLTLALDEHGLWPATPARVHLVAEVTAIAPGIERERPPLSVILAVDTSGSMHGPPIEHVIASIDRLVALLEPTDRVGLVAFSDNAAEVVPLTAAGSDARRLIGARARRLVAEGGTNIDAGLVRAASMMPARGQHERQVILLLSDGAPNVGRASPADLASLARSFRPDVGVSTLGYGQQHNEDVLRAVSEGGSGRYHFIADPKICESEFAQAIGAQGDMVAEAIEITLAPAAGVEIARFLGSHEVRFGATGIRITVPDMLDGSRYLIAAELALTPSREAGPCQILRATLGYRRAGEREPMTIEEALRTSLGEGPRAVDPEVRAKVLRARADEVRAEARALADRGQWEGAAAVLRRQIQAIQAEPWFVAGDGSPLGEAVEQLVDEAAAMERKPNREAYRTFRKSQIGTMLSVQESAGPRSAPRSRIAMSTVAGKLPAARLVVITGDLTGKRFKLAGPRTVIGRTAAADVQLGDANVSRQHVAIVGQNGRFLVVDLGSTNTSLVNGQRLAAPTPLKPGDVLQVGEIQLRYEEDTV
jgi:Ca-activated chloride channel homolog